MKTRQTTARFRSAEQRWIADRERLLRAGADRALAAVLGKLVEGANPNGIRTIRIALIGPAITGALAALHARATRKGITLHPIIVEPDSAATEVARAYVPRGLAATIIDTSAADFLRATAARSPQHHRNGSSGSGIALNSPLEIVLAWSFLGREENLGALRAWHVLLGGATLIGWGSIEPTPERLADSQASRISPRSLVARFWSGADHGRKSSLKFWRERLAECGAERVNVSYHEPSKCAAILFRHNSR